MTNNKPNDVRVVSVELLEELLDAAKWKAADFTKASPYRSKIDEVVRRTKDLLAQPADQQGEPVAWLNEATGHVTTSSVVVMDWDDEKEPVQSLYRHAQPAEAKVVLPERLPEQSDDELTFTGCHNEGWNDCLDEAAKLNTPQ